MKGARGISRAPRLNEHGHRSGGSQRRKRRASRLPVCPPAICNLCGHLKTETRHGWLRCAVHS